MFSRFMLEASRPFREEDTAAVREVIDALTPELPYLAKVRDVPFRWCDAMGSELTDMADPDVLGAYDVKTRTVYLTSDHDTYFHGKFTEFKDRLDLVKIHKVHLQTMAGIILHELRHAYQHKVMGTALYSFAALVRRWTIEPPAKRVEAVGEWWAQEHAQLNYREEARPTRQKKIAKKKRKAKSRKEAEP